MCGIFFNQAYMIHHHQKQKLKLKRLDVWGHNHISPELKPRGMIKGGVYL